MNQKRPKSKLIKVRADELVVHPVAQRTIVPANLRRITATMDLDAIGVLHAVEYPIMGKTRLYLIDGQHRWKALMDLGFGEWQVEVKVHMDITDDKAACDKFLKLNKRAVVCPYDTYIQELHAGYQDAVGSAAIARRHGLRISNQSSDASLCCVSSVKRLHAMDAGKTLDVTLQVILGAWGSKAAALEGKLLEGVGAVFAKYNDTIDKSTMMKKLAKYPGGPSGLIGDARGIREYRGSTLSRCVAERVIEHYNAGRRSVRLEPL